MDRLERLVNLVAALIDTRQPLTRAEIRERIEGYSADDDAFRRNFERDKDLLRQMGIPVVTEPIEGTAAITVQRIKDWEKTIRKRNGIVGFCTQSAQDALSSRISSAIIEQAATQIFMINPKAQEGDYCGGFGLTQHEFELIRTLPDSTHCFLIKHGADSVVARLNLSGMPDILKVLSGRESTVRALDALRSEVGDAPSDWLPRLLEQV